VRLDREAKRGISDVKGEIYQRTGINSARLRQKMRIEVNVLDYATREVLFIL